MYENRTIPKGILIQLNEHCTEQTIEESIALIYQCYIVHCQRQGLTFCSPIMDALGQQHIPHQFKQALYKYLWVNDLYLSPLSKIKETYLKILNQI